jgi:16S rRNA G966 N2-methylase RsmD
MVIGKKGLRLMNGQSEKAQSFRQLARLPSVRRNFVLTSCEFRGRHPMSNDESGKPVQRYSRFSRSIYEDAAPPVPPEDPSLTEIATRALRAAHHAPPRPAQAINPDPGPRQPEPPEPSPYWNETARQRVPTPPPPPRHEELRPAFGREVPEEAAPQQAPAPKAERRIAEPPKAPVKRAQSVPSADKPSEPGAFARAFNAARAKAGPALINSAFWLAHNLRRREIRKRYNKALVFAHTRIADRQLEKLFFVSTLKSQSIDPAPERGIHYDGPVPAAAFNWAMALLPEDLRQFAFIDVHAGRGRTALLATRRNFNRIIAYEYEDQLFDDLSMNIAQFPRSLMACRNIDCYRGDIDGIRLPDQPCVIYFSGAWREHMIPGVMNYARDTYRKSPRRIYVILENVDEETEIERDDIFQKLEPALAERLKLRLLSPMDFRIYRTIA